MLLHMYKSDIKNIVIFIFKCRERFYIFIILKFFKSFYNVF